MKAIYLTDKDYRRLQNMVKAQRSANGPHVVADLGKKLKQATIVPSAEVPVDVVTMNSTVRLKQVNSRAEMIIMVVYPNDVHIASRKVSVLSPLGTAVIGCKEGDIVEWPMAQTTVTYKVEAILYQPEAEGIFYL